MFTEDVEEMKSLPRQKVLDHLTKHAPALVVPYLVSISSCVCVCVCVQANAPDMESYGTVPLLWKVSW